MFNDLANVLSGENAIPFEIRFDLKNVLLVVVIVLVASTLFTLTLKALK
jgi:hypothetical protein